MGKAVVSTPLGAEGLEITDGEHVLIADEPSEFATKVIELLRDQGLREKLGRNGRRLVESRYDWSAIAPTLGQVYETLQA
jgi:glycosyltransferase involved in cell wall biosynthesis